MPLFMRFIKGHNVMNPSLVHKELSCDISPYFFNCLGILYSYSRDISRFGMIGKWNQAHQWYIYKVLGLAEYSKEIIRYFDEEEDAIDLYTLEDCDFGLLSDNFSEECYEALEKLEITFIESGKILPLHECIEEEG